MTTVNSLVPIILMMWIKSFEGPVIVNPFPPCISNAPTLNYHVGLFTLSVTLPNNSNGYTATYQTCCRVNPLANVFNSQSVGGTGSTYSCSIPPYTIILLYFQQVLMPFAGKNVLHYNLMPLMMTETLWCTPLPLPTTADVLKIPANVNPAPPAYSSVGYINGFTADSPLGDKAIIDPQTGIISGIAPDVGKYVVCVAVSSYRNGVFINEHRKDFIVNVTDCDFAGVELDPKPVSCDGFSVDFSNDNTLTSKSNFLLGIWRPGKRSFKYFNP